jgi:prepilin-type N-terminal cleavage/methylation domain-containing protein
MSDQKGFSLIEIIAVLVVIGILAAIALPNYNTTVQQGAGNAAQNNLVTIYNAQKSYYFNNNVYCVSSHGICNSSASINTTLSLNITDSNFTYTCTTDPLNPFVPGFVCYATNNANPNFLLTLKNNPIVLPGGTGCTSGNTASCNPSCQDPDNPAYCPS